MKLLVADDHSLIREAVTQVLEQEQDVSVESVPDLTEALQRLKDQKDFDIVLLDYAMPGMNGLEGLNKTISVANPTPVAVFSGVMSRTMVEAALEAGASGYVPKTLPSKSILNALRFMVSGEIYVPLEFSQQETLEDKNVYSLSNRERQVLSGICEGKSNKEIALDLGLQEVTIKLHVKTLSKKLSAKNRTHAAMIAKERNLV